MSVDSEYVFHFIHHTAHCDFVNLLVDALNIVSVRVKVLEYIIFAL